MAPPEPRVCSVTAHRNLLRVFHPLNDLPLLLQTPGDTHANLSGHRALTVFYKDYKLYSFSSYDQAKHVQRIYFVTSHE